MPAAVMLPPSVEVPGEMALAVVPRDLAVRGQRNPRGALFLDDLLYNRTLYAPQLLFGDRALVELRESSTEPLLLRRLSDPWIAANYGCRDHEPARSSIWRSPLHYIHTLKVWLCVSE